MSVSAFAPGAASSPLDADPPLGHEPRGARLEPHVERLRYRLRRRDGLWWRDGFWRRDGSGGLGARGALRRRRGPSGRLGVILAGDLKRLVEILDIEPLFGAQLFQNTV